MLRFDSGRRAARLRVGAQAQTDQDRDSRPDGLRPGREPLGRRRDGARRDQQGGRHQRRRQAHADRAGPRRHQRDPVGARRHQRDRARHHARQGRLPDRRLPLRGGAGDAGSGDGLQEDLPRRRRGATPSSARTSRRTTTATSTGSASRRPRRRTCSRTLMAVLGLDRPAGARTDLKTDTPKVAILAEKAVWTEAIVRRVQTTLPKMKMEVVGTWQPSRDRHRRHRRAGRHRAQPAPTSSSRCCPGRSASRSARQMGERNMKAVAFGINVEGQKDEFWQALRRQGELRLDARHLRRGRDDAEDDRRSCKAFKQRYKKVADLQRGDLRRDHAAEGRDRAGEARIDADKLVPAIEKMAARRHRRGRRPTTSATTWSGRSARPPASPCSGRTARRCRSGRRR